MNWLGLMGRGGLVALAVGLGLAACGDDDGGGGAADGGVDGGIPEVCPFRPTIDDCQVGEDQPAPGQCAAGEGCYWLTPPPCAADEDCREGTVCRPSDLFLDADGEPVPVCQEDLDMDGELEPAARAFCQTVLSDGAVGDDCERFDDCVDGLTCIDGTCQPYCCGDDDCAPDEFCFYNVEQRGAALGGRIGTCRTCQECTLTPNGGCGEDEGCYVFEGCATCLPAGGVLDGEACVNANDCSPGSACVRPTPDAAFRCQRLCVEGAGDCDAGRVCQTGLVDADPTLGTCVPRG